jgi:hypothetical protein
MNTLLGTVSCFASPRHGLMPTLRWYLYYLGAMKIWSVDRIVCVNDGRDNLPQGFPFHILPTDHLDLEKPHPLQSGVINLLAHSQRLGRKSQICYPGVWRSLRSMIAMARQHKFKRLLYIEWDFFVLSSAMMREIADTQQGAAVYWSPHYNFPEVGLQIICEEHYDKFLAAIDRIDIHNVTDENQIMERALPITEARRHFQGDRYPEFYPYTIPPTAHYAASVGMDYAFIPATLTLHKWSNELPELPKETSGVLYQSSVPYGQKTASNC